MAGAAEAADHLVGEARGVGLLGALEIVRDKATKASFNPQRGVAALIANTAQENGLIIRPLGGDIVAFCPPLIISESEIDEMMDCFRKALDDTWTMVREKNLA